MSVDDLFERCGQVDEIVFDADFLDHMEERNSYEKHDVSLAEIAQAHLTARYFENEGSARIAPIIMVGITYSGRYIVVPLAPTGIIGQWRPITAFEANRHHRERYEEAP